MRVRIRLYIETSVFGFYFDKNEVNRYKRDITRKLFEQIKSITLDNGYEFNCRILTPEEVIIYEV